MIEKLKKYNFWDGMVTGIGFNRSKYQAHLGKLNAGKTIVTVTGLRRVGKSFIIRQFIDFLIKDQGIDPHQIFYVNLFLRDLDFLKNPDEFQKAVELWKTSRNVDCTKRMYIFIDEVQEINDWQKLVCSFYEDYTVEYKLFITGSNSKLLSGELGTYLAGRSHELTVYPLSFEEYRSFKKKEKSLESLSSYLKDGGMPEIVLSDNAFARNNLIETTIDSIIMRDIVSRYEVRNIGLLRRLVDFISCSATDEISRNKIANLIRQTSKGASVHTISDYIEFLKQAFFIHECPVFSYQKNALLKSGQKKIYLNDPVFIRQGQRFGGFGKLLENCVYIEFKRRGCKISTVKAGDKEVDFLSEKNGDRRYYQVTWTTGDYGSQTYKREFGNLMRIKNHFPKFVISMDTLTHPPEQGIKHIHALDFFL